MNKFYFIGKNIKSLRERAGLTQEELADMVGGAGFDANASQPYIRLLEKSRGEKMPSVPTLASLAKVLGASMEEICGIDESEPTGVLDRLTSTQKRLLLMLAAEMAGVNESELSAEWSRLSGEIYASGGRKLAAEIEKDVGVDLPISDEELAIILD